MTQVGQPDERAAEETVCGMLLASSHYPAPKSVARVYAMLRPEMFYYTRFRVVYEACHALHLQGKPPEVPLVMEWLREHGKLQDAEGEMELVQLQYFVSSTINVPHFAELVRSHWERRMALDAMRRVSYMARNGASGNDILAEAERALLEVREQVGRGKTTVITGMQAAQWYDAKLRNPPTDEGGVAAVWPFLQNYQPARLYILGGYPKDGKTVIANQAVIRALATQARVGYATIEMSWQDLTERWLSAQAGVPATMVQQPRLLDDVHRPRLVRAVGDLAVANIDFIDDPEIDSAALHSYQRAGKYDLLVVDHLHRFDWTDRRDLERHVRNLVNLARLYEIPVLLLAQLARRDRFPRPTMAMLRESGMIEAEAARVDFIWRERDDDGERTEHGHYIVAANRFGTEGSWPLYFERDKVRFTQMADEPGLPGA